MVVADGLTVGEELVLLDGDIVGDRIIGLAELPGDGFDDGVSGKCFQYRSWASAIDNALA